MNVILLLLGKRFYAHRICLLASSDAFRAMFDGGYRVSISLFKNFLLAFNYTIALFLNHFTLST
jgi:hypothetical protein